MFFYLAFFFKEFAFFKISNTLKTNVLILNIKVMLTNLLNNKVII